MGGLPHLDLLREEAPGKASKTAVVQMLLIFTYIRSLGAWTEVLGCPGAHGLLWLLQAEVLLDMRSGSDAQSI